MCVCVCERDSVLKIILALIQFPEDSGAYE